MVSARQRAMGIAHKRAFFIWPALYAYAPARGYAAHAPYAALKMHPIVSKRRLSIQKYLKMYNKINPLSLLVKINRVNVCTKILFMLK